MLECVCVCVYSCVCVCVCVCAHVRVMVYVWDVNTFKTKINRKIYISLRKNNFFFILN